MPTDLNKTTKLDKTSLQCQKDRLNNNEKKEVLISDANKFGKINFAWTNVTK